MMSDHTVRSFLDLSTGHLPPAAADPAWLPSQDGVIARAFPEGWWLWIPPDIDVRLDEQDPDDTTDTAVVAIWRLARRLGCDWALIDSDGPRDPDLAYWTW